MNQWPAAIGVSGNLIFSFLIFEFLLDLQAPFRQPDKNEWSPIV